MSETLATQQTSPIPYTLFDRADDDAVLARIKGQALKRYVYRFPVKGGQDVYGLGIDGAEACKRELARAGEVLEEEDVSIERDEPEAAYFKAKCSRWAVNKDGHRIKLDSALGMKRQEKFMHLRSGTVVPDPFWFEKGCSKAIRNALLNLTPLEIQERVIEAYKGKGQVVTVEQTEESSQEQAGREATAFAPADEERAALMKKINAMTDAQRKVRCMKLLNTVEPDFARLDLSMLSLVAEAK